ncbi:hypothetical protein FIBSPDRAFT_255222 [Athelia psychrophila]|uniref:Uncharacterized protein n=1 Tax=Athelia psychrophila TaxID=1759441 RepID=A0A165XL22_9AGAM|nr:hypothetical protein FIBSPDRAFT_255222 [Fibularhizoctonia sp. CBS 109695]
MKTSCTFPSSKGGCQRIKLQGTAREQFHRQARLLSDELGRVFLELRCISESWGVPMVNPSDQVRKGLKFGIRSHIVVCERLDNRGDHSRRFEVVLMVVLVTVLGSFFFLFCKAAPEPLCCFCSFSFSFFSCSTFGISRLSFRTSNQMA